jgi:hypothetical protein
MYFAVVNVEVQTAGGFEQPVVFSQARLEEGQVIVKDIGIAFGADLDGLVAPATKAGAVAIFAAFGADLRARLGFAGVERWIDVDQVDRCGRQGLQNGEVVTEVDTIGHTEILTGIWFYDADLVRTFVKITQIHCFSEVLSSMVGILGLDGFTYL